MLYEMAGEHSHGTGAYQDPGAVRAVLVSAAGLGIAAAVEFWAAYAGRSAGVLADALHNAGDVLTTGILLGAFALARRPATRRFTSGFGRIEDVATLLIVLVIVATAALAAYESIRKLVIPEHYGSYAFSLAAAAVGIVANLGVSELKLRVGRRVRSSALEADGVHSRIDAVVSAGAFMGIGLAGLGLRLADPIAGLVITLAILYILAGTVRDLFYRMMDAVDPHLIDEITRAATQVPGVLGVHDVRARWVGRELVAVMHVDCDENATLKDAHSVVDHVAHEVEHAVPAARIEVHMDPGTDPHRH
jgi:cation diffusion facilitator family transporter